MVQSFRMVDSKNLVLGRLRRACLTLPETSEVDSWGHPNFRAGKRTFVAFEWFKGRPSIAFRLNRTDIEPLLGSRQFFATPYGRGQWVSLWVDGRVNWRSIRTLAERSYRIVALKRMIASLDARTSIGRPRSSAGLSLSKKTTQMNCLRYL